MGANGKDVMRQAFGSHEWWKSSTERTLTNAADRLLESGWGIDDAADYLEMVVHAVAEEYGE